MKKNKRKALVAVTSVFWNVAFLCSTSHAATAKDWLSNITNNLIKPSLDFLQLACLLGGIGLVIYGCLEGYKKSKSQQGQQITIGSIIGSILVGVILIGIFAFANMASETVTGNSVNVQNQW